MNLLKMVPQGNNYYCHKIACHEWAFECMFTFDCGQFYIRRSRVRVFDNEYLGNGDRQAKYSYCHQMGGIALTDFSNFHAITYADIQQSLSFLFLAISYFSNILFPGSSVGIHFGFKISHCQYRHDQNFLVLLIVAVCTSHLFFLHSMLSLVRKPVLWSLHHLTF